jgi:hypothetical protein
MKWVFIVIRDNTVEKIKFFDDFWKGADFTDQFISMIDPTLKERNGGFPAYNRGEYYTMDTLTIGLFKETTRF